jgi:hypothetical protein
LSRIKKADALRIVNKIGATLEPNGAHQTATLEVGGLIILRFGVRHGRDSGHGHLCGEHVALKINESKVVALARCTLSKDQYFQILTDIGLMPAI